MSRTKYLHLLEDPEVKRWYQNAARSSRITADLYLGRLGSCNTRIYVKYEAYIDRDKNSLTRYGKMHVGYENNIYRS
jgi:hypothetical protein